MRDTYELSVILMYRKRSSLLISNRLGVLRVSAQQNSEAFSRATHFPRMALSQVVRLPDNLIVVPGQLCPVVSFSLAFVHCLYEMKVQY